MQEGKNYYIIIDKSDYELKVYDDEGWYATYPIVFGSKDLGDKMREGDKRTPNGHFKIIQKRINPKWGPQMLLDYPTAESFKKFKDRKAHGEIPKTARTHAMIPAVIPGFCALFSLKISPPFLGFNPVLRTSLNEISCFIFM